MSQKTWKDKIWGLLNFFIATVTVRVHARIQLSWVFKVILNEAVTQSNKCKTNDLIVIKAIWTLGAIYTQIRTHVEYIYLSFLKLYLMMKSSCRRLIKAPKDLSISQLLETITITAFGEKVCSLQIWLKILN